VEGAVAEVDYGISIVAGCVRRAKTAQLGFAEANKRRSPHRPSERRVVMMGDFHHQRVGAPGAFDCSKQNGLAGAASAGENETSEQMLLPIKADVVS